MGSLISQETSNGGASAVSQELLDEYRDADLSTVVECVDNLAEEMGSTTSSALDFAGFDEVFCIILGDMEEHFVLFNRPINGQTPTTVDSHEVFCAMILYCKSDTIHRKIDELVKLFDYDRSGNLSQDEMVLMLMSGARGLCKLAGMVCPPIAELEQTAERMFKELDEDGSKSVETEELVHWLATDKDVMAYISRFVGSEDAVVRLCKAQVFYNDNMAAAIKEFEKDIKAQGLDLSDNPEIEMEKVSSLALPLPSLFLTSSPKPLPRLTPSPPPPHPSTLNTLPQMMEILEARVPHHEFTEDERETMFKIFDIDGNGLCDFHAFCGVMPS
jgi:Ca2+-binding EF-hand superfamily protein